MKTTPPLARIDDITRRYARYSRSQAGLSAAWAGLCVALLGGLLLGLDLIQYANRPEADRATGFLRFLISQGSRAQPPFMALVALGLPTLWLWGRARIQRCVYERDGTVVEQETPQELQMRQFCGIGEIALPICLIPLQGIHLAFQGFPAGEVWGTLLSALLLVLLPFVGRRMVSLHDRTALVLLVLGSGAVLAGGYAESLLVMMIAYSVLGAGLAAVGLRAHWQFLKVRGELDALAAEAGAPPVVAAVPARTFSPRLLPREAGDAAIAAAVGAGLAVLMFVVPAAAIGWLTGSSTAASLAFCLLFGTYVLYTVDKVTLDAAGIRFHRIFGEPKFLAWERVLSIEEAPRRELILSGWLWPLFPPRETTVSCSSIGHQRISWEGGHCYFPPADEALFKATAAAFLAAKATSREAAQLQDAPRT